MIIFDNKKPSFLVLGHFYAVRFVAAFNKVGHRIKIPVLWNFALPADRKIECENNDIWQKSVVHAQNRAIENSIIPEFCVILYGKCPQNRTDGKSVVSTKVDRQ